MGASHDLVTGNGGKGALGGVMAISPVSVLGD